MKPVMIHLHASEEDQRMTACKWHGAGDYDVLLTLSEQEMRALAEHYRVDWSFFTTAPAKHWDDQYFCFASFSRKALALLPFLSLAFGGMYDEPPVDDVQTPITLDYSEFRLEEFSMQA